MDFMVKVRGYSIELGAVEAAIEENLAVHNCVVVADGAEGEDKRLVAYLVPDDAEDRRPPRRLEHRPQNGPQPGSAPRSPVEPAALRNTGRFRRAGIVTAAGDDRQGGPRRSYRSRRPASNPGHASRYKNSLQRLPVGEKEALLVRIFENVLRLDADDVGTLKTTSSTSAATRSPRRSC